MDVGVYLQSKAVRSTYNYSVQGSRISACHLGPATETPVVHVGAKYAYTFLRLVVFTRKRLGERFAGVLDYK